MRFRFVHAADLHLDAPVSGVRRVPPFVAEALRDASLEAFEALVSLAIGREAAFVVLAGDLYEGPDHGIRAQLAFRRGLERLDRAGIVTFIAHGEHDPLETGWAAIRSWPARVHLFGSDGPTGVSVERDGETVATVLGMSHPWRGVEENLAARFTRGDAPGVAVGVLHANVGDDERHAPVAPASLHDLREAGLDYWALGHVHARQVLLEDEPWIVYPGTLQARSHAPVERGAKGAFVVEVDGSRVLPPEFVALDRVRFAGTDLDVGGVGDLAELAQALVEVGEEQFAAADRRSVILRVRLTGAGPVVGALRRPGTIAELLGELRDNRGEPQDPFLWWEHLEDATVRALDLDAMRRRGDFTGALLDVAGELEGDAHARAAFAERHLAAASTPELTELAGDLPDPVSPEAWRRAVDQSLDALVTDSP